MLPDKLPEKISKKLSAKISNSTNHRFCTVKTQHALKHNVPSAVNLIDNSINRIVIAKAKTKSKVFLFEIEDEQKDKHIYYSQMFGEYAPYSISGFLSYNYRLFNTRSLDRLTSTLFASATNEMNDGLIFNKQVATEKFRIAKEYWKTYLENKINAWWHKNDMTITITDNNHIYLSDYFYLTYNLNRKAIQFHYEVQDADEFDLITYLMVNPKCQINIAIHKFFQFSKQPNDFFHKLECSRYRRNIWQNSNDLASFITNYYMLLPNYMSSGLTIENIFQR